MCSLTDGAGTAREPNASGVRSFTVALEHLGRDDRWAMWSREVGNGMTLEVNQGNGNLLLEVPLGSYATPIGAMDVTLAYNALEDTGFGMSPGWDIAVGPRQGAGGLPVKLYQLDTGTDSDVKLRFQGGRIMYYPHKYAKVWGGTSAMSGYLVKAKDNTWTFFDASGGIFTFSDGALTSAGSDLLSAKPAATGAAASNKEFTYTYDASLNLQSVSDPLGRKIDLIWNAGTGKLDYVRAPDFGANQRAFAYTGGKLTSITTSVTNEFAAGTGAGTPLTTSEVVSFAYDAAGLLSEVSDGVGSAASGDGWDIVYGTGGFSRVTSVTAPSTGSPPTNPATPSAWRFGYVAKNNPTQNAKFTCLTDPRNTAAITCDSDFATNDDPNQTQTEFSDGGLPIKIAGAKINGFRPVTTYVFDSHNNLVCERSPEANALGGESCTSATGGQGAYTDLDDGGLSTVYDYASKAPYRLLSITHPAPADGAFPRLVQTYAYDEGSTFNGLWAEEYRNDDLDGTPAAQEQWTDLDRSWGAASSPTLLADPDGEHWGLRLSGYLDISALGGGQKYLFRVFSDDGVRLSVEGKTILDCFGQATDAATSNCGTGLDVGAFLYGTDAPIQIEYSDITGPAQLTVKWDQGSGTWQTIPAWLLIPDLGLVTSKTYEKLQSGGGTPDLAKESWTFPDDDSKSRRLQGAHTREDLGGTANLYTTSYTYGATYGHVLTETANSQAPTLDTKLTYTYTDGAAPGGWGLPAGAQVSCVSQTVIDAVPATDPVTTNLRCDQAGRTTRQALVVEAVTGTDQVAQTRTTDTSYDSVGRITRTRQSQTGAEAISVYDASGRLTQTRQLITSTTYAISTNVYDHAGHLASSKLPDPATGGQSASSPVISHIYDWADNELSTTNANAHTTSYAYDALNRLTQQTTASGAISTTTYQLGTGVNQIVDDTPGGASTTTVMDVLGRVTSTKLESYAATSTAYDVQGNVTAVTDPAGITTSSTYSGLGEVLTRTDFSQGASAATTTYAYDAAGRLLSVDGPRAGTLDQLTNAYDDLGRLSKTTYEGIFLEDGTTKASVSLTSNDAAERIRVREPLTTTTALDRFFTFDEAGRQIQARTENGTTDLVTTTTYNLAGWPTLVNDARPLDVYLGYDFLGRLLCRHTATCTGATSGAERFTYDKVGNVLSAISISPAPTYNMTYDTDERPKLVKRGTSTETTYTYGTSGTANALLTSLADPAGTSTLTYNAAGQLFTLDDPLVTTAGKISTYTYDGLTGKLTTRTDVQANLRWGITYEAATGRLDTQEIKDNTTLAVLASFDLGYGEGGNVTSKVSSVFSNASNATWGYTYDGAGRLTKASGENAAGAATVWDYTYDGAGNRTGATETTGAVVANWSTTYDRRGLASSASEAVSGEALTYGYDAAGLTLVSADSSIGANDRGYTYDAYSRLTCAQSGSTLCSASPSANRVTYTLDAFSRTYQRTANTTVTDAAYRGVGETPVTSTTSGTLTKYARTLGGSPLGQKVGAAASYYLRDPHGDTVGVVSTAAANQGTTAFDAYGRTLATSGTQPWFGYQSDPTDSLTKQVDMGTRWYAPQTGRFSSQDVLFGDPLHPISLNRWVYGADNPVTMWDPTGMRWATATVAGGGGCGGTVAECDDIAEEFIQIEAEDPGYFTENFQMAPKPEPPEAAAPDPVRTYDDYSSGRVASAEVVYERPDGR